MPKTAHFRRLVAGSTGQRKSILRNLVSSLIIHESINTTLSKAKAVQPYAERVITMGKKYAGRRDQRERATAYLYDWKITMPKLFDTLATRYQNRPGGYTRVHRLPPRYGDMAPQAILELVDGTRDMQFSMTARRVARSSILATKWLSESTKNAMHRIIQFRENGAKEFDEEVERQKALLLKEDKIYEAWKKSKEDRSLRDIENRIDERALYTTSRHNRRRWKTMDQQHEEKKRRDAYVSEEEKKAEYVENLGGYKTDDEEGAPVAKSDTETGAARLNAKKQGNPQRLKGQPLQRQLTK